MGDNNGRVLLPGVSTPVGLRVNLSNGGQVSAPLELFVAAIIQELPPPSLERVIARVIELGGSMEAP